MDSGPLAYVVTVPDDWPTPPGEKAGTTLRDELEHPHGEPTEDYDHENACDDPVQDHRPRGPALVWLGKERCRRHDSHLLWSVWV